MVHYEKLAPGLVVWAGKKTLPILALQHCAICLIFRQGHMCMNVFGKVYAYFKRY